MSVPAAQMTAGMICQVHVENGDGAYFTYSAVGITTPAENIESMVITSTMLEGRRGLSAVVGNATASARFLYALGGDSGSYATAKTSIELAPLSGYGQLGQWRYAANALPAPRTDAAAVVVGNLLYLVGGHDGTGPKDTTLRAEILDPNDAPHIVDLLANVAADGLTSGTWHYRVSAVMAGDDPTNPDGETLPSDPFPVQVPDVFSPRVQAQRLQVTLVWDPVPGAQSYRVYRTAGPNMSVGDVQLLAVLPATETEYTETGSEVISEEGPLSIGDVGVWQTLVSMSVPRAGLGVGAALDPSEPNIAYIYAVGGQGTAALAHSSYEVLALDAGTGELQSGATWLGDPTNPISVGRMRLGLYVVDSIASTRLTNPEDTWIYAAGGETGVGAISKVVDAAKVSAGGFLGIWESVTAMSPGFSGFGLAAAANQLFVFGGQGGEPSSSGKSAQICGIGNPCGSPPDVQNWNAGIGLLLDRYLVGSVVGAANIFILGGVGPAGQIYDTVEQAVW